MSVERDLSQMFFLLSIFQWFDTNLKAKQNMHVSRHLVFFL